MAKYRSYFSIGMNVNWNEGLGTWFANSPKKKIREIFLLRTSSISSKINFCISQIEDFRKHERSEQVFQVFTMNLYIEFFWLEKQGQNGNFEMKLHTKLDQFRKFIHAKSWRFLGQGSRRKLRGCLW